MTYQTKEEALARLCRGVFNLSNLVPGLDLSSVEVERVSGLPHPEQEQSLGRGVRVSFIVGTNALGKAEVEDGLDVYAALGIGDE